MPPQQGTIPTRNLHPHIPVVAMTPTAKKKRLLSRGPARAMDNDHSPAAMAHKVEATGVSQVTETTVMAVVPLLSVLEDMEGLDERNRATQ